jgi:hypothetical protein
MKIVTRSDAKMLGLNKYFTGIPCKNGHISERYTQTSVCQQCVNGVRNSASSGQIYNLRLKADNLRNKSSELSILAIKNYSNAIAEAERIYKVTNDNAASLLKQAEELETKISELENFLTSTENSKLETQIENQKLLEQKQELRTVKSSLMTQRVLIIPEDKTHVESTLLALLQRHSPLLTLEDMRYRNKCEGGVMWTIKCHPDDVHEVLRITNEVYNRKVPNIVPPVIPYVSEDTTSFNDHMNAPMM